MPSLSNKRWSCSRLQRGFTTAIDWIDFGSSHPCRIGFMQYNVCRVSKLTLYWMGFLPATLEKKGYFTCNRRNTWQPIIPIPLPFVILILTRRGETSIPQGKECVFRLKGQSSKNPFNIGLIRAPVQKVTFLSQSLTGPRAHAVCREKKLCD